MPYAVKPVKDFDTTDLRQNLIEVLKLTPMSRLDSVDESLKQMLIVLKKIEENTRKN